jgi:hypothetical protein
MSCVRNRSGIILDPEKVRKISGRDLEYVRTIDESFPANGIQPPRRRRREHRLDIWLPDDVYDALKDRAREQHCSMQGQGLRLIETDVRRAKTKETP